MISPFADYVTQPTRASKPTLIHTQTPMPSRTGFEGLLPPGARLRIRLVEKFAVLGRDDIAGPLERILPYVLSQDANIEILTLLLALSDRPVDAAEFNESKFLVEKEAENGVTWEDILAEEPLVGDHWQEPDYEGS